jgi:methionine sulfoxide reductase heme-binding subunit
MLASTSTTIWYTMRATGVVALILLTGTMVLGILTAGRTGSRAWPAFARADLHKRISLLAMVFLALHVLTAVVDTYVNVGWGAIVIPFASPFRPLWTGLGTVGVDLMLAVAVSSALRQRINPRTWRGIHWLAYGSWPVAMAHSLGMGTDAWVLWMDVVVGLCTATVAGALFWRIVQHRASKERAALAGASTHTVPLGPAPRVVRSSGSSSMPGRNPSGARTPSVTTRVLEKERP